LNLDSNGIPERVSFARLGVECDIIEPYPEKTLREASELGRTFNPCVDERLQELRQPCQLGITPSLATGGRDISRRERRGGEPPLKTRKVGSKSVEPSASFGPERRWWWKSQLRRRWQAYRHVRSQKVRAQVAEASSKRLEEIA